jgi:hypothetical protein
VLWAARCCGDATTESSFARRVLGGKEERKGKGGVDQADSVFDEKKWREEGVVEAAE